MATINFVNATAVVGGLLLTTSFQSLLAQSRFPAIDSLVDVRTAKKQTWLSLQQALKGTSAGLYVLEPSGEPGTKQAMFLRGSSTPLIGQTNYYDAQPAVFVNGIPVIDDNTFIYGTKNRQMVPPGTNSNILAGIDLANVVKMEVVTDPVRLAQLGPLAANGAIMLETADKFLGGNHVNIDGGLMNRGYRLNATIGNHEKLANYLFTVGSTSNNGVADDTRYTKYNIGFYLNIQPVSNLFVSTQIQVAKSGRIRNRSIRERLSEMEYMPMVSNPFTLTETNLGYYNQLLDDSKDDNDNVQMHGKLALKYQLKDFRLHGGVYFDYITNSRSVFWPSGLMENVNFASDFSAYNRRFYGEAGAGYDLHFGTHTLKLDWAGTLREDKFHYTYDRGYDGEDDKKQSTNSGGYKQFYGIDQLCFHQFSSIFTFQYLLSRFGSLNFVLRQDASSAINKDHRWLVTPGASGEWDIRNTFGLKNVNALKLSLSWSRIGRYFSTDTWGIGSIYTSSNANYGSEVPITSYYGYATITRPYSTGWIGYQIAWPVAEKWEADVKTNVFNNRLSAVLSLYRNLDKNMVTLMPVSKEYGYQYTNAQGMEIENKGVELSVSSVPVLGKEWSWNIGFNMAYNKNTLKALPGGVMEIEYPSQGIGTSSASATVLKVGEAATGDVLPTLTGGLDSKLAWKNLDLSLGMFFATGQKAMMKEGLLENASYAKLRYVTLGYNVNLKKRTLYVYASANNLLTLTSFSGEDPELIDFDGVYRGYGMKIPTMVMLGFKVSL